jgi:hypothetical protein
VLTYLVSTAGLGVLVLVLVSGRGELAALNWPVVIALVLLAVLVSLVRRARRR